MVAVAVRLVLPFVGLSAAYRLGETDLFAKEEALQNHSELESAGFDAGTQVDVETDIEADAAKGLANQLIIMSWNMQDFDEKDADKGKRMNEKLGLLLPNSGPTMEAGVILLQEISSCRVLDTFLKANARFKCVNSVVDSDYEDRMRVVLGNVILYNGDLFAASHKNRVQDDHWKTWNNRAFSTENGCADKNGLSLEDEHQAACNAKETGWVKYGHGRKGCNVHSDTQEASTVLLKPKAGRWTEVAEEAFEAGVNFVDIHLFSGKTSGLSTAVNDARRAFQFRTHLWRTQIWAEEDRGRVSSVYAGDFNTGDAESLKRITAGQASDFSMTLYCAFENKLCSAVEASNMKSTLGRLPLDHVVVDRAGVPSDIAMTASSQEFTADRTYSDHAPIVVSLKPKKKNTGK